MQTRSIAVAVAAGLLAGVFAAPLAAAAADGSAFDGTYAGDIPNGNNLTARYNCVSIPGWRVVVKGGVATTRWNGPLSGPVSPDGSLTIEGATGTTLTGKFTGNTFAGTVTTKACRYSLAGTKS